MTERATISVVPCIVHPGNFQVINNGVLVTWKRKGLTMYCASKDEANSKADSLAADSKAGQEYSVGRMDRFHGHFNYAVFFGKEIFVECGEDESKTIQIVNALNRLASTPAQARDIDAEWENNIHQQLDTFGIQRESVCRGRLSVSGRFNMLRDKFRALTQPQAVAPDKWDCPACHYDNKDAANICEKCGAFRSDPIAPEPKVTTELILQGRLTWWENNLHYKAPEQLRSCLAAMFKELKSIK